MSAVTTVLATVAATAGAIALYRFIDSRSKELRDVLSGQDANKQDGSHQKIIDFERDPVSGAFRPKH